MLMFGRLGKRNAPAFKCRGLDVISDCMNLDTDIGAPVDVGRILLSKKSRPTPNYQLNSRAIVVKSNEF